MTNPPPISSQGVLLPIELTLDFHKSMSAYLSDWSYGVDRNPPNDKSKKGSDSI